MAHRSESSAPAAPIPFEPVSVRPRRRGWSPERQVAMVEAIAQSGCIAEACRRIGMSRESFYALEQRPDAQSFRLACQVALDYAVRRIGEGAFSRAVNGVEVPHYYRGELVGTHRRYDERLTMFILRTRDPARFGKHVENGPADPPETVALKLRRAVHLALDDALREAGGAPRMFFDALPSDEDLDDSTFIRNHLVAEPVDWEPSDEEVLAGGEESEPDEGDPDQGGPDEGGADEGGPEGAGRARPPASGAAPRPRRGAGPGSGRGARRAAAGGRLPPDGASELSSSAQAPARRRPP